MARRIESPLDALLRTRIAAVNNLHPDNVINSELNRMYRNPGDPVSKKYLGVEPLSDGYGERKQQVNQLIEALFDYNASHFSYGLFAPTYREKLQWQQDFKQDKDQPHESLLIGALTSDSIKEYAHTVNTVYSKGTRWVMDVAGYDTPHIDPAIAKFQSGSALEMPFDANTFDSAQTNILLPNVRDVRLPLIEQIRSVGSYFPEVYEEIERVLRPDGIAVMVEPVAHADIAYRSLRKMGFDVVDGHPARRYRNRRDMEEVIFDPTQKENIQLTAQQMVVYARKMKTSVRSF